VDSYCPLEGTAGGAGVGTVWWSWRLGSPEFPYPSAAPLAQPTSPGAVTQLAARALSNSLTVTWAPPTTGKYPLVNYTVLWTVGGSSAFSSASVPASASRFVINGLPPSTPISYQVWAWNLHWHSSGGTGAIDTLARPKLITNFTTDPSTLDLEMPLTVLTSVVSNLTDPVVSYAGLPAGCSSENATILICQPTQAGVFQLEVTVVNPLNESDIAYTNVTINPELSPVQVSGPTQWDANTPVNLSVSVSGTGTPPYTYAWRFDDGSNASGAAVQHVFTSAGFHVIDASATDKFGEVQNGSLLVTIHPALAVSLSAAPQPVAAGAPVNVSATVGLTGTAPYLYHWSPVSNAANAAYQTFVFATPGTDLVSVSVVDSAGATSTAMVGISVVIAPLVAYLTASSGGVSDVGVPFALTLAASGGTPPYAVALSGAPFSCSSSDETHWECDPTLSGTFEVEASLRDAAGLTGAAAVLVNIHPRPVASLVASVPIPVHPGDSVDWLVAVTGGTPPFTFTFTELPPGCSPAFAGLANLTCVPMESGSFPVAVSVTDAFGVVANASTILVVISIPTIPQGLRPSPLNSGPAPITLVGWLVPLASAGGTALGLGWALRPPRPPAPAGKSVPPIPPPREPHR
ncbi:MAG: PKD domain-containing protein, partial [Thermoplasmata archaeon]|nr:PKD domain-containing protein [Thermoplasmata archaeon]